MPKFNTAQLTAFIKAHAAENYSKGWDVVVETMSDDDIAARLGKASSNKAALEAFADLIETYNEQRDAHRNEALAEGAEPTLGEVVKNMTDLEKRVVVAMLNAGMDCNGAETVDAVLEDNTTWSDVAETAKRTGLSKKSVVGVIASLATKGLLVPDCDPVNGEGTVQQVLTDWGIKAGFELLAEGVEATAPAPAPKPVKVKPAPKTLRVIEDRVIVAPATDLKMVKPVSEGSKRHLLAEALLIGATVERLQEVTGWNKSTATSALRWDVPQMGLGVERKGDKYFLLFPAGVKAIPVRAKDMTRADALVAACK